jgi:hypothetical protein
MPDELKGTGPLALLLLQYRLARSNCSSSAIHFHSGNIKSLLIMINKWLTWWLITINHQVSHLFPNTNVLAIWLIMNVLAVWLITSG